MTKTPPPSTRCEVQPQRRAMDTWLARANLFWDWIDARQIDRHVVAAVVLAISAYIVWWCTHFAELHPDKSGGDLGLIFAAIGTPWAPVQTYALKYWFESRDKP